MFISCIPHFPYFTPAVTIPVLQDIRTVISNTNISTCNTGQCEGDAAILSLFVSLTKQEDSVVHIIHPNTSHWPGQPGRGDHLPVRVRSEELSGVKIVVTKANIATSHHQHLVIG